MKNKQYCKVTINTANGPIDCTSHFNANKFHGDIPYIPKILDIVDMKTGEKIFPFSQSKAKNHL